jgi:hypothetical protein
MLITSLFFTSALYADAKRGPRVLRHRACEAGASRYCVPREDPGNESFERRRADLRSGYPELAFPTRSVRTRTLEALTLTLSQRERGRLCGDAKRFAED